MSWPESRQLRLLSGLLLAWPLVTLWPAVARAESCTKSRDFILDGASDLPQKPKAYLQLFRDCLSTLELSNVKDAFILKAGAIAVLPRQDTVAATASTLAQFCERFPRGTLHFVGRKERASVAQISRAIEIAPSRTGSCERIKGGS